MKIQSYLSFGGRCEEALEFYKTAAGAEVTALMRWTTTRATGNVGHLVLRDPASR